MLSLTKDGDNLKALKALLPTYAGKIKCIYIDPPYNTGNENWVYNDNVSSPMMQEWLDKVVDKEDFTRHDKWLCMMMPRLKLLRDLLKEGLCGTFSYFELARYVYYTATGEEFDPEKVDEERNFIGESKDYEVYLFYKPDIEYLRTTALTLDKAKNLGEYKNKKRLVFAPSKYLDHDYLLEFRIDYCQLPFEIYKLKS